jgi:hypothetical protein
MNKKGRSRFFLSVALLSFSLLCRAQKLPNIQTQSSWNADEHKPLNDFQAFNRATEIFYTISNDLKNVYLDVRITDQDIINKILRAGLSLTFNRSKNKNDKNNTTITYPFLDTKAQSGFGLLYTVDGKAENPKSSVDSVAKILNDRFEKASKQLKLLTHGVTDTISIYNDRGIKVTGLFDESLAFKVRIVVPTSLLNIEQNKASVFYNVKINPINYGQFSPNVTKGITSIAVSNGVVTAQGPAADRIQQLISATDFWGEYILSKKK